MTREELERLGALLFGYGWKARIAEAFEINRKTVSRWYADDHVPDWAATRLRDMVSIAPPPDTTSDQDRDDACAEALEPRLTDLRNMAIDAGWHPAEIAAALFNLAIGEIRQGAGDEAAEVFLQAALSEIR